MPTLLEFQRAMRASLIERRSAGVVRSLADGVAPDRLDIYRNTIFFGLTRALRLAYPAVERLVGGEFFEGAAQIFVSECLPRTAYLDQYGDAFPDFLRHFPPAASLPYIADVAALEWAANRALHAADDAPLELSRLTELTSEEQRRVSFRPHSSIGLLRSDFPVDEIWRAVLDSDDQALAALDLAAGPVFLLVERSETGIEVTRTQRPAWNFLAALCRGEPLSSAVDFAADLNAPNLLAEHLAAGRFSDFALLEDKSAKRCVGAPA